MDNPVDTIVNLDYFSNLRTTIAVRRVSCMPTTPAVQYTPDNAEVLKTLGIFADLITETVNFGTHVLEWEMMSETSGDETAPVTLSMRHILELLDSSSINIRSSCVDPCRLILRGALESLFAVKYILESDRTRRAMAFMVTYVHDRLRKYRKLNFESEDGRKFKEKIRKDQLVGNISFSAPHSLIIDAITNMESLLKEPEYRGANSEFHRRKKETSGFPAWHSLYGGPRTIESLAEHVGCSALYNILYRQWSTAAHGMDIIQGKIAARGDKAAVLQLRLPTEAQALSFFAVTIGLELIQTVIRGLVPERMMEYQKWYSYEIRSTYLALSKGNPIRINYDAPT